MKKLKKILVVIVAIMMLASVVLVAACGNGNNDVAVTSITIQGGNRSLALDANEAARQLSVTVEPENATNPAVTWTSSNNSVATINSSTGLLTLLTVGTTNITATSVSNNTVYDTITVTVNPVVASVVIDGSQEIALQYGDNAPDAVRQRTLTAIVTTNPADSDYSVSWASDNPAVTVVPNAANSSEAVITAVSEGTAIITATSNGQSDTITVTVSRFIEVTDVTISGGELTEDNRLLDLRFGATAPGELSTRALTVSLTTNPAELYDEVAIAWESSNSDIVTVEQSEANPNQATITAIAATGQEPVTITASAGGETDEITVTSFPIVQSVNITGMGAANIVRGDARNINAIVVPGTGVASNLVTWLSSDTDILTIESNPTLPQPNRVTITAVSAGPVTITATSVDNANVSASFDFTVVPLTYSVIGGTSTPIFTVDRLASALEEADFVFTVTPTQTGRFVQTPTTEIQIAGTDGVTSLTGAAGTGDNAGSYIFTIPASAITGNIAIGDITGAVAVPLPPGASTPISSVADLDLVRDNLNGNFHLTQDIDFDGGSFTSIGNQDTGQAFRGVFDGRGFALRNLNIAGSAWGTTAIFSLVHGGEIRNLSVINASNTNANRAALLVTTMRYGTIENVFIHGTMTDPGESAATWMAGGTILGSTDGGGDGGAFYAGGANPERGLVIRNVVTQVSAVGENNANTRRVAGQIAHGVTAANSTFENIFVVTDGLASTENAQAGGPLVAAALTHFNTAALEAQNFSSLPEGVWNGRVDAGATVLPSLINNLPPPTPPGEGAVTGYSLADSATPSTWRISGPQTALENSQYQFLVTINNDQVGARVGELWGLTVARQLVVNLTVGGQPATAAIVSHIVQQNTTTFTMGVLATGNIVIEGISLVENYELNNSAFDMQDLTNVFNTADGWTAHTSANGGAAPAVAEGTMSFTGNAYRNNTFSESIAPNMAATGADTQWENMAGDRLSFNMAAAGDFAIQLLARQGHADNALTETGQHTNFMAFRRVGASFEFVSGVNSDTLIGDGANFHVNGQVAVADTAWNQEAGAFNHVIIHITALRGAIMDDGRIAGDSLSGVTIVKIYINGQRVMLAGTGGEAIQVVADDTTHARGVVNGTIVRQRFGGTAGTGHRFDRRLGIIGGTAASPILIREAPTSF